MVETIHGMRTIKALAIEPQYVGALIGLGQIAARLGRPQEALERFDSAIEIDPHQCIGQHLRFDPRHAGRDGSLDDLARDFAAALGRDARRGIAAAIRQGSSPARIGGSVGHEIDYGTG